MTFSLSTRNEALIRPLTLCSPWSRPWCGLGESSRVRVDSLGVSVLGVHLTGGLLHVLLCLIPVLDPASVQLSRGPIALGGPTHRPAGPDALGDVPRLFGQLVFVDEAALLVAHLLGVGPGLLLPGREDAVEDDAPVVHHGGDEEDVLPLLAGLREEHSGEKSGQGEGLS